MASGSGSGDFFDMSSSCYNDTNMDFDGSSSDTLLKVTVEEKTEFGEWGLPSSTATESVNQGIAGQPVVGVKSYFQEEDTILTVNGNVSVQQDDLCQDDMFSLDELSAVEEHPEQLDVETTVCVADVATSVLGHGYELNISSSEVDMMIPVSGASSDQGLNETDKEKITMSFIHGPVDGSDQETSRHTQPGHELIGTSTLEGCMLGNLQFESVKLPSDVHLANKSWEIDNDQQTSKDFEKMDDLSEDFPQNELLKNDNDQLKREVLEDVNVSIEKFPQNESVNKDTDQLAREVLEEVNVSIENFPQNESVNDDTNQLTSDVLVEANVSTEECQKLTVATDGSTEKESKEQTHFTDEVITNSSEQCSSEDIPIEASDATKVPCGSELDKILFENGHELPEETNDVTNIDDFVNDQKESMQLNQSTQPEGLLVQVEDVETKMVVSTEMECESHLNQSQMTLKEQMSVSDEQHLEPSVMKAEANDTHFQNAEIVATKEEHGSQHEQELKMAFMKKEEDCNQNQPEKPSAMQTTLMDDHKPKSEDVDEALPASKKTEESEERQVCMPSPSAGTNELSANVMETEKCLQDTLKQTESTKEEIVSLDLNHSGQEEPSQNVLQSESVVENTAKMTSHMSNLQDGTIESHAEHVEDRDGEQGQLEFLKGRKVSKRFGKRKFMGEVIGYDPASKWFKVLYEDGDEEELVKHELDAILIPLGEKASVSRKRRLSSTDNEQEESNRSGRKSRKLDTDGTPGQQKKNATSRDQTSSSRQPSSTKKGKSNEAKSGGKSKSPKINVRETEKGKNKATSSNEAIEKNTAKKSQSVQTKRQQKSRIKGKSLKNQVKQEPANQHMNTATRKLKYGSAMKKTPANIKQKAKDTPNKGNKVETLKSEADSPGRKRKAVSEIESGVSTVSNKRAKKDKIVNDVESPPEKKIRPRAISEVTPELESQAKEDKAESSVPSSTEKKGGSANRGTLLVGRKVKKDFGGKLYGGEIVGYKLFYKVKYEDGDSEDLTWKELEPILLPEEDSIVQSKNDEQQHGTKRSSVRSKKGKKKN